MDYQSVVKLPAKTWPGVEFTVTRMSFMRRLELTRRIWELARRVEFLEAGGDPREKLEAALLTYEIDRVYLEWGLAAIEGLEIDGVPATCETAIARGPEELLREIADAIKAQCGLSAEQRKN